MNTTHSDHLPASNPADEQDRRGFLHRAVGVSMFGALAAAYGTLAVFMARFAYPAAGETSRWMYVTGAERIAAGEAIVFRTPLGSTINIARQGEGDDSLVALSSTCPHLGCQVHWEAANDRFFCPCHNGVFDPAGVATSGPPAEAGQSLPTYPLKVENGLLFIELEAAEVAAGEGTIEAPEVFRGTCPIGPGHDPCLFPDLQRASHSVADQTANDESA